MGKVSPLRGMRNGAYRDLIVLALKQGWTIKVTGGNHLRLDPPPALGGGPVFAAASPGEGRGERNLRSVLRKRGVDC